MPLVTDEGYSDSHGKLLHCDQSVIIRLLILYVSGAAGGGNVQVNVQVSLTFLTCDSLGTQRDTSNNRLASGRWTIHSTALPSCQLRLQICGHHSKNTMRHLKPFCLSSPQSSTSRAMTTMTRWVPLSHFLGLPTRQPQGTSRYHKNKKVQRAPKQAIKEASKKARREKARLHIYSRLIVNH